MMMNTLARCLSGLGASAFLAMLAGGAGGCGGGDGSNCPAFIFPMFDGAPITCSNPFAAFQGHITASAPRLSIAMCKASILDENGSYLLADELMGVQYGADSSGNPILKQGCGSGLTPANVGEFVYMTKRISGTLTFRIDAYDDNIGLVQTGFTAAQPATYPPEVQVSITMQAP